MQVLIADDHPVVRRGVRQTVLDDFPTSTVLEAASAAQFLALARTQRWDIAILDISLPDRNGLDVLKDLRREYPSRPVIILSMHPEEQFAVRVLRAGASAYITKEGASEELKAAIQKALTGGRYLTKSQAERLAMGAVEGDEALPSLSDREYQILFHLSRGRTLTEIAQDLNVSPKTVSTYRTRLLEKLGARTNVELVTIAVSRGIVNL
jgi:DNA-binding NarL/FixJ family response regulator